jgi:hypothetical protein
MQSLVLIQSRTNSTLPMLNNSNNNDASSVPNYSSTPSLPTYHAHGQNQQQQQQQHHHHNDIYPLLDGGDRPTLPYYASSGSISDSTDNRRTSIHERLYPHCSPSTPSSAMASSSAIMASDTMRIGYMHASRSDSQIFMRSSPFSEELTYSELADCIAKPFADLMLAVCVQLLIAAIWQLLLIGFVADCCTLATASGCIACSA